MYVHKIYTQGALFWFSYAFLKIDTMYSPGFFRVSSLAVGKPYDCPTVNEVTLKDMDKLNTIKPQPRADLEGGSPALPLF